MENINKVKYINDHRIKMLSYEEKLQSAKLFIALIDTASEGKTSSIVKCLDEGANINEQFVNDFNNTPLHISVMKKDLDVVNLLLKRGAKTNYRNQEGKTALDVAKELDSDVGQVIIELLYTHETKTEMNKSEVEKSLIEMNHKIEYKFQKRVGTSGIKGQLYETKLITLIRIRSFINEYDQFYLGTSLEGIGALDDICVRYKQNNEDVIVFLQAKHRAEVTKGKVTTNDLWKPTGDFSLFKYFDSYMKIRERFNNKKMCNVMFHGKYEDFKCYFVIYTSAGNELEVKKTSEHRYMDKSARNLIQSGKYSDIFQYQYTDEEVDLLTKSVLIEEIKCLGRNLFGFIKKNKIDLILTNNIIRKYHVVLARNVINVSDVNNDGYRTGTFRDDFFNSNDDILVALKEVLFNEAVKASNFNREKLEELVQSVLIEPTTVTISKLMQSVPICYDYHTNTLAITKETSKSVADALSEVKIRYNVYQEAYNIAVKDKLNSLCFKLPTTFGNIDIAVSCGKKGAKRLEYLAGKLEKIISHFKDRNVIINDDAIGSNKLIDAGVMDLNGGLGSAMGNLLISCGEDRSLRFNVNYESLGKNAKILLKILESKINYLDTYKLKLDVEGLPKLSLKADARDRILAKDFFNKLWFYTNQAKENEIESNGKEIIANYCIINKHASERTGINARFDAIYFKIHDEVQKWWMSEGESNYLTNDKEIFNNILKENLENSFFTILSRAFMKRMKIYDIEFDKVSVQSLCKQFGSECTVIVTEVITLTGIKLVQHFQTLNDYAFINLDSSLLLSVNDRNVLKEEIQNKKMQTLIIIYEDVSEFKSELFRCLLKETTSKQLIIVTSTHSYQELHTFFSDDTKHFKVCDEEIELHDLVPTSQRKILNRKLIYQGNEITFDVIIEDDAKYLLTPRILQKIINNEKIVLGRTLSNPNYEEIKYYYVDRRLSTKNESEDLFSQSSTERLKLIDQFFPPELNERKRYLKLNTFEDINDTVVLIGASGSGKSSFLTHMSIKTKQRNRKIWIERINLLDYAKEFHGWQKNKIKIDRVEALKFVCKSAVMSKITSRNNFVCNFDEIVFDLDIVNEEVLLKNYKEINFAETFQLEMFIYFYNKGNTVLLFDGFDEICPHYKNEVIQLLKCLVKKSPGHNSVDGPSHNQRVWIASRSYNSIVVTFHTEFGASYDLEELTLTELKISMDKFFKRNLNLNELDYAQFININGFFEYMKGRSELKKIVHFKSLTFLLNELYLTAIEYFQREAKYTNLTSEKYTLTEKWSQIKFPKNHFKRTPTSYGCELIRRDNEMKATTRPLHMYVALEYFTNEIKNIAINNTNNISKWNLEANTLTFYKYFLETKLQKIRFEQKNQMDLYNPDVKLTYERERKEYLDKHKKIAFYATFIKVLKELLTKVEIDEMKKIIKEFEGAEEKTGVVDYIINGVPKFIHLTFQEYLTVEYITDWLRTKPYEDQRKMWKFIFKNVVAGVLIFLDVKLMYDNEFQKIIISDKIKQAIFNDIILLHTSQDTKRHYSSIVWITSEMRLRHLTRLILTAMVHVVNEYNLTYFISFLNRYNIFSELAVNEWDEIAIPILDRVREIDPSKLYEIKYSDVIPEWNFAGRSNEEIIRHVRTEIIIFRNLFFIQRALRKYLNDKLPCPIYERVLETDS